MSKKTVAGTPADPTLRFATVEVDGAKYSLIFDYNAIALAESLSGANLLEGLQSLKSLNAGQFRGLLYAALVKAHPDITIDQVGSLLRLDTIPRFQLALAKAYTNSLPESKPKNPPAPVGPAN